MMKMLKKLCFVLLAVAFVPFGCDDGDDPEIDGKDVEGVIELLKAHPWKLDRQLVDGQDVGVIYSEDDPYVVLFRDDDVFEYANFTSWEKDEKWQIVSGQLFIEGDPISIDKISDTELVIRYTEDGAVRTLYFNRDEPADAFPDAALGKTYRMESIFDNDELQTIEDYADTYRVKILMEEHVVTATEYWLAHYSWERVTGSFVFMDEFVFMDGDQVGLDFLLEDDGDILLTYYYARSGSSSESASVVHKGSGLFRECNLWDFIAGPDWILQEVEKNGEVITEDLPFPLGTIWYFNSHTNQLEEKTTHFDPEPDYMPWSFNGTPNDERVQIDITDEDGTHTLTMMKGNIAELELQAVIDSDSYLFKFGLDENPD